MAEGDLPFSGIDQLILLADLADGAADEALARAIRAAHGLASELTAKGAGGGDQSWGTLYFQDAEKRAVAAVKTLADVDPTDAKAVFEIKATLSEYRRVAEFRSELLKSASDTQRAVNGEEIYDRDPGFDGEDDEAEG